jgi:lipopolysaccharide transport system permease protein
MSGAALTQHETVISPPGRWTALRFGELWEHRELIYFLTKRELQVRYKQSFFGVSWALFQPLVMAFVLALFFGKAVNIPIPEGIPFAVFAVIAMVPWLFTATAIAETSGSLVADANLMSKVYFPRLALPLSKALSLMVDLAIGLPVMVAVPLLFGVSIESTAYLVPAFLLLAVVTAFGIGTLFAAINVKYRDVTVLVPMLVQIMFFITPILYSATLIPESWHNVWALNPLVSVVEGVRWALVGTPFLGTTPLLISVASSLAILLVALRYFQRTQHWFADVV